MARAPGPGRGPGQKPARGQRQKQRQRPGSGPKQGRGPGAGKGQKTGPGPGKGQKAGPGQGRKAGPGQKAGPRSEHGPAVPLRSRKEKKDNMKPKHPDEQEIPFRLRELMRSREALKRPDLGKRQVAEKKQQQLKKCQSPRAPGDIPVPRFRRGRGESERSYICRMEQEVQRVLFLAENQIQREPEKEATAPEKSKRKKEFQKRKLEKARKKKEEKKEAMLEKSLMQDTVPFGEVVTQPPTITSRPRGQGPAEQAGRKQLLLTPRLGRSQASPVSPVSPVVSMARRRILEEERARVIRAYRDIQRRKQLERERARAGPG
ncbi:LOW QUALITY PROTEIN: coiled-coil domain-containing protein 137 [Molothrus ater]|uniref:LOW QUALITY PROTEIN: coiled-coil domain-containing protein 137 n=1 Tax=Molothrus ater TaxID=84834 RepID=UPI0023E7C3B9|nr:LOW QUALITY PROTEIN: coiled-coil domain-containing protein 137 [Molothrus ater]